MIIRTLFLGLLMVSTTGIQGAGIWHPEPVTTAASSTPLDPARANWFKFIKNASTHRLASKLKTAPALEKASLEASIETVTRETLDLLAPFNHLNFRSDRNLLKKAYEHLDKVIKNIRRAPRETILLEESNGMGSNIQEGANNTAENNKRREELAALQATLVEQFTHVARALRTHDDLRPQRTMTPPLYPLMASSAPTPHTYRQPAELTGTELLVGSI